MTDKIDKIREGQEEAELADFLPYNQVEKISEISEKLKQVLPEVMTGWNDLFQAKFHLSEDVAGKIDGRKADYRQELGKGIGQNITVYDHTFGCPTKCTYCGYNTVSPSPGKRELGKQLENKRAEMELLSRTIGRKKISSLYFGGGTPTVLPTGLLSRLIQSYSDCYDLENQIEVTVEAHPLTINKEKIEVMAENGVNRLSIGVQSLNKEVLKQCNRKYDEYQALNAISLATNKIKVVNADLIYGLKGQSIRDHLIAMQKLSYLGVNQFTLYATWLKDGSEIDRQFRKGEFVGYASPLKRAKMYLAGKYFLENRGYRETLGGWFTRGGDVEIYQKRWIDKVPCFGVGPGAYSYSKDWHYENSWDRLEYAQNLEKEILPVKEFIKFGIKEREVVDLMWKIKSGRSFVVSEYQKDLLNNYLEKDLLIADDDEYKLSETGEVVREWMIGDMIRNSRTSE